jgi:multimeric flavodoxin WrbA
MKSKVSLLAMVGSQRQEGNSYHLARTVLDSLPVSHKTVQLAEKNIGFCTLCERCKDGGDCILQDDFNDILKEMQAADGIVFSLPKYLLWVRSSLLFSRGWIRSFT